MGKNDLKQSGVLFDSPAEATILGSIMIDNNLFFEDSVDLATDDFFIDSHLRTWAAINDILSGHVEGLRHVDIRTLSHVMNDRGDLQKCGGVSYLAGLTEGLPLRPVIEEYVRIVKEKSRLRRLRRIFTVGIERIEAKAGSAAQLIAQTETELVEENASGAAWKTYAIGEIAPAVEAKVETGRQVSEEKTHLEFTWGLAGLDKHTRGAFAGEMTVIGADSSGGKTSFLCQMILANAREGTPCGIFSLEMTKEQMARRFYPLMSDILTSSHMRDPRLMNSHTHIPEMHRISQELQKLPIRIDDTGSQRIDQIRARMRMMRKKFGTRIFGIDYIQLLKGMPHLPEKDRFVEIVYALRDFPKAEPDVHLLALSQYSNADGFVKKKKRTKESLYGGSVIHHAAQNILLISVEDPDKRADNDLLDTEFTFAKQRDGKRGKVTCCMDRDHYLFLHPQRVMTGG